MNSLQNFNCSFTKGSQKLQQVHGWLGALSGSFAFPHLPRELPAFSCLLEGTLGRILQISGLLRHAFHFTNIQAWQSQQKEGPQSFGVVATGRSLTALHKPTGAVQQQHSMQPTELHQHSWASGHHGTAAPPLHLHRNPSSTMQQDPPAVCFPLLTTQIKPNFICSI